jgi:hypothetical protein
MSDDENVMQSFRLSHQRAISGIESLRQQTNEAVKALPLPESIFHYTNDVGLHGILGSGKIWLTDMAHLNDPSELQHGVDIAFEELKIAASTETEWVQTYVDQIVSIFKENAASISRSFVCCFSDCGDELSQWRAYADNARGYAIAFDGEELEKAFANEVIGKTGIGRQAFPVSYDESALRSLHRGAIRHVLPEIVQSPIADEAGVDEDEYFRFLSSLASMMASSFFLFSTRYKHPAYKTESEYRFHEMLLQPENSPRVMHRVRRNSLVPYCEFDWRRNAPTSLKKIVVGPAADRDKSIAFVKEILQANGYGDIEIEVSKIPYRAV